MMAKEETQRRYPLRSLEQHRAKGLLAEPTEHDKSHKKMEKLLEVFTGKTAAEIKKILKGKKRKASKPKPKKRVAKASSKAPPRKKTKTTKTMSNSEQHNFVQSRFPRIGHSSSEFLNDFGIAGQKLEQPGDEQKRTPAGKEILSQRARLLNRISQEGRPNAGPTTFGVQPVPRKFVQSAKRGPKSRGRHPPIEIVFCR